MLEDFTPSPQQLLMPMDFTTKGQDVVTNNRSYFITDRFASVKTTQINSSFIELTSRKWVSWQPREVVNVSQKNM